MNVSAFTSSTGNNVTTPRLDHVTRIDWVAPVSINLLLIVLTLWILLSLIHYGVRTRKWRRGRMEKVDVLNAGIVYTCVVVCAAVCELRYVSSLVFMNIGFNEGEEEACETTADVASVFSSFVMWSAFLFLWFRQRAFYTNKMLSFNVTRCVKGLSLASVILITSSGTAYVLFFIIPINYKSSPHGCIYRPNNDNRRVHYGVFIVAFIVLSHALLLGLFIYPLLLTADVSTKKKISAKKMRIKHPQLATVSEYSSCNISSEGVRPSPRRSIRATPPRNGIRLIMLKTFVFSLLSVMFDVLTQVLVQFVKMPTPQRRVYSVFFDVASFASLLFLIFSFATYKQIFKTFCIKPHNTSIT